MPVDAQVQPAAVGVAVTGGDEIAVLQRGHDLFAGSPAVPAAGTAGDAERAVRGGESLSGGAFERYQQRAAQGRTDLRASGSTDAQLTGILQGAADEHAAARQQTRVILDAARADPGPAADTPMGQRELMRRRIARLRAQHRTVSSARLRALRRLALIRALRYGRGVDMARLPGAPNPRAALAIRAALSKLGRPYVWGATGPNAFDCSGLTQWAYKQAGIDITRTTWTQIHAGAPVPPSMIAPGDLVFPNRGHVQMYIGNGQVVEAPYSGANIRISSLGNAVAIRRPIM